jgi:hypothetical protein
MKLNQEIGRCTVSKAKVLVLDATEVYYSDPAVLGHLLEQLVECSLRGILVNGTLYHVEEGQIPTQCGGTLLRITPVDVESAYTYVTYLNQGDVPTKLTHQGSTHIPAKPSWELVYPSGPKPNLLTDDEPLRDYHRNMVHINVAAINDADLDVLLVMLTTAIKEWEERACDSQVSYSGAYCDPTREYDSVEMMGAKCTLSVEVDPPQTGGYQPVNLGESHRCLYMPSLDSTVAAVIAVHVNQHHRYNQDGAECYECGGSGSWEDEIYDEEYDEWRYHEIECEHCEGTGTSEREDDEEYVQWQEQWDDLLEEYQFNGADYGLMQNITKYRRLTWGDQCYEADRSGNVTGYMCNWAVDWETQGEYEGTTYSGFTTRTIDALFDHIQHSHLSSFSLTSDMGKAYGKTPQAMEMIANNQFMFEQAGFTIVMPECEATNPNEGHHYIHSIIITRNPRVPTHRSGLIDFDDPCMIQGKLGLQEVA